MHQIWCNFQIFLRPRLALAGGRAMAILAVPRSSHSSRLIFMRMAQVVIAIFLMMIDAETIMRRKGEIIGKLGRIL